MSKPAIRFRLDLGPGEAVGPGKIALLEQIAESGSLSQAARDLKMSYKRAWQLLESLNSSFKEPLAVTATGGRRGGGATLTELGRAVIRSYRSFDRAVQAQAARHFRPLAPYVRRSAAPGRRAPVVRMSSR
ncbi:MAG TPA: LysR family transcriptional regulator [Steroidobacteraceae bacterium]|nr:LysR family transcriptional regulator [Steroidobacteraceae bacterium]